MEQGGGKKIRNVIVLTFFLNMFEILINKKKKNAILHLRTIIKPAESLKVILRSP